MNELNFCYLLYSSKSVKTCIGDGNSLIMLSGIFFVLSACLMASIIIFWYGVRFELWLINSFRSEGLAEVSDRLSVENTKNKKNGS